MKRNQTIATIVASVFAAVLGLARYADSKTIDAVSSASGKLRITGGSTTATTATLNFSFPYSGTNRLYYDVVDHSTVSAFAKFTQTSTKTFNVANLASGTKYFYWVQIVDPTGKEPNANAHSALTVFTTEGASAVSPRQGAPEQAAAGATTDPLGRQTGSRLVRISPNGSWIDLSAGHR